MQGDAAGEFGQQEIACKRKEHAETKYLQRMLPAQNQRPQPGRFQSGRAARDEVNRDLRQRQEVREPEHVQIGLADGIDPLLDPARQHLFKLRKIPGKRQSLRYDLP